MLKIVHHGVRARPQIFCDHCGQRITNASDGYCAWQLTTFESPVDGRLFYMHKRCHDAFERSHRSGAWQTMELSLLPAYLGASLELDWQLAQTMAGQATRPYQAA
jgi:hypothetical protein